MVKPADQHPSIAVLPFANMSRDPDDEYFSDGLAEEIINLLAHVPNLKVTARTSSFAFRGKEQDIRRIAEALGVRTILEGSVRRAGSRIRVTAQLINAEDGYHLWSERYDRRAHRRLRDSGRHRPVHRRCACKLKLISNPARHTPNFPAYEALLKARHHARAYVPEAHARAKEYCEQAIALDPEYAAPHALLGFNYLFSTTHTGRPMPEVAPLFAAKPAEPWNWTRSKPTRISCSARWRLHTTTTGWKPPGNSSWPWPVRPCQPRLIGPTPACTCSTFGRFEESTAEMRRAVEQDPLSVMWRGVLMAHLVCAGRYEEALHEGLKALDIAENEIHPHLALSRSLSGLGESRRSRRLRGEGAS